MRDCNSRSKWTALTSSSSSRRRMDPSRFGTYWVPNSRHRVFRFPEQLALRLAFVHDLVAGVGYEGTVLLVLVPEVIAPVISGKDFEGLLAHEASLEVLLREIDAAFLRLSL